MRTGAGTGRGRERERGRDGKGDGNESSSGDRNEDEDGNGYGNEDRIGEGRREAKKRKKPHKSSRRRVGNGRDLGEKTEKRRQERVGPVAAYPDNLENDKEAGRGGAQGTQGLSKNCTNRESVLSVSRLVRDFRNKYHSLWRINASSIE